MKPVALFLVGPPGVGKTTLVRELLGSFTYLIDSPKWTVGEHCCAAGHYTGQTFDGADTVPYNGAKAALEFWAAPKNDLLKLPLTIFDGDRFSNKNALEFVAKHATVKALLLEAREDLLAQRRRDRGSKQNETWIKGRVTKARNFVELVETRLTVEANGAPPGHLALIAQQFVTGRQPSGIAS